MRKLINSQPLAIQGTADGQATALENVSVDHGSFDAFVAQQFLDSANIVTGFEQVGSEAVAQGVRSDRLDQAHPPGRLPDRCAQAAFVQVMAPNLTGTRIKR
jgi:hypothetical protein